MNFIPMVHPRMITHVSLHKVIVFKEHYEKYYQALLAIRYGFVKGYRFLKGRCKTATAAEKYGERFQMKWDRLHGKGG